MQIARVTCLLSVLLSGLSAQDDPQPPPSSPAADIVMLNNGDRISGTLKTASDGKITFRSSVLGELEIPIADIADLQTAGTVELLTNDGERVKRRITGLADGALQLATGAEGAPAAPSVGLQALAKINPPVKPPPKWTGSLAIGGFMATGNTDRRSIASNAEAVRRSEMDRFTAKAGWNYAEEKTAPGNWNLSERRTSGALKYDYFLSEKLYVWASTSATGDTRANIDLRFTAGGGLGYQWIEREDFSLLTEAGLAYFVENYRDATPDTDNLAARVAAKAMYEIIDGIKLFDDLEAFPSIESSDDIYLTNALYTRISLTDSMFAEPRWELDYDNTPSPGFERLDHRYFLSVGWTF